MNVYLDTSVVVRRLLRQSDALASWGAWDHVYSSMLTRVEFMRTMDRLRLAGSIGDSERLVLQVVFTRLWHGLHLVDVDQDVLERAAGAFPTVVGALDAIHLASALKVRESTEQPLRVATHDIQLGRAAEIAGLAVEGV